MDGSNGRLDLAMAFGFPAETIPARRLSLQRPNGYRPRLLLAEDSDPIRIVTAAMLKGMGCDVDAVIHGEDAVKSATAAPFDVIVLDIEMPVMDGIAAARSIRRLGGAIATTPIMALSAFLADAMQSASWRDTFDIALPKPANRNELHAAVAAALNWNLREAADESFEAIPLLSAEQLVVLKSGISEAIISELAAIACRDIADCMARIIELGKTGQGGASNIYIHKLRALGSTFAAPRLAAVTRRIGLAETPAEAERLMQSLAAISQATIESLRAI